MSFYGGVRGLAHTSELGLEAGQKPKDVFSAGQVVKARILAIEPATGRIRLSLTSKKGAAASAEGGAPADACNGLQPGDLVEGVVRGVQEGEGGRATYLLEVSPQGASGPATAGRLEVAHLADHPVAVEALKAGVRTGVKLGE